MAQEWDGNERRRISREHDLLIRMDQNLSNHMKRVEEHFDDDKESFSKINENVEKLGIRTGRLENLWARIAGGLAVLIFLVEFLFKVWK